VSAETRAENFEGWIGNDYNSDEEHNISENVRSCMGRFARYHRITVTSVLFPYTEDDHEESVPADLILRP
jgi:hypothetical protein